MKIEVVGNGPQKPPYSRIGLLDGIKSIDKNIEALNEAIKKEEYKKKQFQEYLDAWDRYERQLEIYNREK